MEILLTKTGKEHTIFSCKRADGSITWKQVDDFFILHDLGHYVVESILQIKNGFFGMLSKGTDITDFDLPKEKRMIEITPEAIFTEHLVNYIVIDFTQGRMDNFIETFRAINDRNIEPDLLKQLKESKLEQIRKKYNELMVQWKSVSIAGSMNLLFEE